MKKKLKKVSVVFLKTSAILVIFAFLFYQASQNDSFSDFWNLPKNWGYLTLAFAANFIALTITIIRWRLLLNVVDVPLKRKEALRIGYLTFLFNLAPVGIVTGDGIRLYMIFQQFPQDKAKGFASIVMDRAIGLYIMFLIAVVAIYATGFHTYRGSAVDMTFVATVVHVMLILIGISTVFALLVLLPNLSSGRGRRLLDRCCQRVPKIKSFILAIQEYRNHKRVLFVSGAMTLGVHVLFCLGIWLIALGFFGYAPTAMEHLVLHPVSNVTQLIPLAVGPYEMVLDQMYTLFPVAGHDLYEKGYGLLIALGYRLISLVLGGLGALFYLLHRPRLPNT